MSDRMPRSSADRASRRATLRAVAALSAVLAASRLHQSAAAQATPTAETLGTGALFVQSFSQGTIMATQGDSTTSPPWTLILWEATARDVLFTDPANHAAGVVTADEILAALGTAAEPTPVVVIAQGVDEGTPTGEGESAWAMTLSLGSLGSDPGAVTYQGALLEAAEAQAALGLPSVAAVNGVQNLGPGYLVLLGLEHVDLGAGSVRFASG